MLDMEITMSDAGVQHLITEILEYTNSYSAFLRQTMQPPCMELGYCGSIRLFATGINLYLNLHWLLDGH